MTTDQDWLKALRIRPDDDIPYATPKCAPCASKDEWLEHVQEANIDMARRLSNAHFWLFAACVGIAVLGLALTYEICTRNLGT